MNEKKGRLETRLASISNAQAPSSPRPKKVAKERAAERSPTYRVAVLRRPSGEKIKCVIKNMSPTGAKVVIEGASLAIKDRVEVAQSGQRVMAEVVWQEGNEVGLVFV